MKPKNKVACSVYWVLSVFCMVLWGCAYKATYCINDIDVQNKVELRNYCLGFDDNINMLDSCFTFQRTFCERLTIEYRCVNINENGESNWDTYMITDKGSKLLLDSLLFDKDPLLVRNSNILTKASLFSVGSKDYMYSSFGYRGFHTTSPFYQFVPFLIIFESEKNTIVYSLKGNSLDVLPSYIFVKGENVAILTFDVSVKEVYLNLVKQDGLISITNKYSSLYVEDTCLHLNHKDFHHLRHMIIQSLM